MEVWPAWAQCPTDPTAWLSPLGAWFGALSHTSQGNHTMAGHQGLAW